MEDKLVKCVECKYYRSKTGKTGEFVILPPKEAGLPELLDKLSDVGAGLENPENKEAIKRFVGRFEPLLEALAQQTDEKQ